MLNKTTDESEMQFIREAVQRLMGDIEIRFQDGFISTAEDFYEIEQVAFYEIRNAYLCGRTLGGERK